MGWDDNSRLNLSFATQRCAKLGTMIHRKRTARPRRGRRILESAARDLGYEWRMARSAVGVLAVAYREDDQFAINLSLECFLLHARNLRDFFAPTGKPDDVLASDFLGRPPRVKMSMLRSRAVRNRLNKRIAHLSYSRFRFRGGWNVPTLMTEIDNAMHQFIERLETIDSELAAVLKKYA